MVRLVFFLAGAGGLVSCALPPAGPAASWRASSASAVFHFDWRLSGDPAVAPLQVFDDGRQAWLQFAPGQPLPAIFGADESGERALPYVVRTSYVVVDGPWRRLTFRGGRLAAEARRAGAAPASLPEISGIPESAGPPEAVAAEAAVPTPAAAIPPAAPVFRVEAADGTLRQALGRWALIAGWHFQPQHWAVDADIPLAGEAEFGGDFKSAVRELLDATLNADTPVQPCFYSNRVLRVVPLAQPCSRHPHAAGGRA